jgi:hypothetical protein
MIGILDIEYKLMKFKSFTAVEDIAFLSSEFLLMIEEDPAVPKFRVFSFTRNKIIHYLELPSLQFFDGYFITHPSYDSSGNSPAQHLNWIGPDPSVDIIVASLYYEQSDRWFLVLSIAKILKALDKLEGDPTIVPWDKWATHATRWLPASELQDRSVRSAFGSRMLAFTHLDLFKGSGSGIPMDHLVLFDFNPRLIRRESDNRNTLIVIEDESRRIVEVTDTSSYNPSPFGDIPTLASLPFRAVVDKRPCIYDNAHLDGTVIVGCMVCTMLLLSEALLISDNQRCSHEFLSFLPRNEELESHSHSSSPD